MSVYNFKDVEAKWQHKWEETNQYKTDTRDTSKPLYYTLEMFPYPSGKIHMGHVRNYSIGDVVARFKKMEGYNVLHPMGWDSFGLPAENAAIKHGIHPAKWTYENIDDMKNQLKLLGLSYDWERELATSNPDYYKFTQEIFLKFLEAGLAYKKKSFVNWCPSCETVLANEQVVGGQCERCDAVVVKKELEQWYFKTTEFAEELLNDLDKLEGWPEKVKTMQRNWIGKSHGAEIVFDIDGSDDQMIVYTTRPDTVYGTTFMALAPENPLVKELVAGTEYEADVDKFVQKMHTQTEIERTSTDTEKEGMFIGKYVINPITGRKVPLWIANYILMDYGTGAIMGVPAHDDRDKEFATKYGIEIIDVIDEDGKMINSEEFNGMDATEAQDKITEKLAKEGRGKKTVNYRLRDWLLSRQRYWGVPIPVVYCEDCGIVPVDKKDLPVLLPTDVEFTVSKDKETQKIEMIDKIVEMSKKDIAGDELEGATIIVTNTKTKNIVDKWVSGKEPHRIQGLIEGETYVMHEEIAIDGYVKATDIEFTVSKDKETQKIEMIDKVVLVSKTDLVTGEELPGAELEVTDKEGNVIDKWTSTNEPHHVTGLEEGKEYTLTEKTCPYGYEVAESINFVVTTDKETQLVEMKDMPIQKTIKVIKADSETKETIKAKFKFGIYEDPECTKLIKEVKADKESGTVTFEDLRYGTYYIKETKAPFGYQLSDKVVKIEINNEGTFADGELLEDNDSICTFTYYNKLIPKIQTGSEMNYILLIGSAIISLLGITTGIVVLKRKNKNTIKNSFR